MGVRQLAVLITCFNRRDKTLACLAALMACTRPTDLAILVVLVDDGSKDGTADAVMSQYPSVRLLQGDGNLYWAGGMRRAFDEALRQGADDYLWLNDDTLLDQHALDTLYRSRAAAFGAEPQTPGIAVGATRDGASGLLSYGGLVDVGKPWSRHFAKLSLASQTQRCITFNGNCVLFSQAVARTLGNLSTDFVHGLADWDYGLRATSVGIPIVQVPGSIGTCSTNPPHRFDSASGRSTRARLRYALAVKQYPVRPWLAYVRRHFPLWWPTYFVRPYASAVYRAVRQRWLGV
jgi:GT2 family glycosyltransferase